MKRVEFRLTMPSRSSWDGGWSGAGRSYLKFETLSDGRAAELIPDGHSASWVHGWDDGWAAQITGRVMEPGERRRKSDGFSGYGWMVDNIIRYGSPYTTGTAEGMTPAGFKR